MHLDDEIRDKIKELRKKLSNLQLEFGKNVNEENKKFLFSKNELGIFSIHWGILIFKYLKFILKLEWVKMC